jgi:hypothetical protein
METKKHSEGFRELDAVKLIVLPGLALLLSAVSFSCASRTFLAESEDGAVVQAVAYNREELLKSKRFMLITPTGEKMMAAAFSWLKGQELEANRYAQKAQCANNVSRVFEMADVRGYSSPLVSEMVDKIKKSGGTVIELSKNKKEISAALANVYGGKLPIGTLVSGCLNKDCSGGSGDGHISMVGDLDGAGRIQLYHNNWYRPENEGGVWKPHMIPLSWYNSGFRRKWMPTPWIYLKRDASGKPNDLDVTLPAIDDLDPTNYYVTIAIPSEITAEIKLGKGVTTDGKGQVVALASTGSPNSNGSGNMSTCRKLKVIDPTGANFRPSPNGLPIICNLPLNAEVTSVQTDGRWTKVLAQCAGGSAREGYLFTDLLAANCGADK